MHTPPVAQVPAGPLCWYGTGDGLGGVEERRSAPASRRTVRRVHLDRSEPQTPAADRWKEARDSCLADQRLTVHSKGAEIAERVATLKPGDFVELNWYHP